MFHVPIGNEFCLARVTDGPCLNGAIKQRLMLNRTFDDQFFRLGSGRGSLAFCNYFSSCALNIVELIYQHKNYIR